MGSVVDVAKNLSKDLLLVMFAWGGEAEIQGEVLLGDYQLHLHQEDSVMVGEDLVYSLILTPFINSVSCLLCQPPFWGCQSRPKLVPQEAEAAKAKGSCSHYWRRRIQGGPVKKSKTY